MAETLSDNSPLSEKSHPGEVAKFLDRKRERALGVAAAGLTHSEKTVPEVKLPQAGGDLVTEGGEVLFFAPAFKHVYDPMTGRDLPKPYTLRDYFSHTAADGTNGPGWDMRSGLYDLSDEQMLGRYGHVFTPAEIQSPSGVRDPRTGELVGGMPDDIPYYDLIDREEYEYRRRHSQL